MMPATKTHSRTTHCTSRSRTSRSLRSAAGLGLGLLSLLSLSAGHALASSPPPPVTWDGTMADWFSTFSGPNNSTLTHWSNNSFPGATDNAVNMSTAAMTLGQSTTINSFFSNGAFTLQGGTFSGNQANAASTLQVNNVFTDDGGQINNFTVNQGTGGSLVFTGNGGNSLNNSIVNANLDLATNTNAYVQLLNTNTLNGTTTLGTTSNGLALYDNATNLVNNGTLQGFGSVFQQNGGATFTNSGTVNANSAGNTLAISTDNFTNSGTTEATNGGTLTLASNTTTTDSGNISAVGTGSVVSIAGSLTGSGSNLFTAAGGGTINIVGASLLGTINTDPNTFLVFNGNGANNFNNTTINGNLDLATNANAYIQLLNTDTLNGTTTLGTTSNGLALYDNASVLANTGSLTGFGSVYQQNGGATLANSGTVNANVAGQTLAISTDNFTNTGTAEATNGGILTLAGNTTTTNTGLLAAGSGGILDISGTLTNSTASSFNGLGGTINIVGASLLGTINGVGATSLVFNGDGRNNFNNTTVNANLDLATNANAYVQLFNTDTLNGTTTLGTTSNGLALYDNATNLVNAGSLTGFGAVFQQNGGATFTNSGTVNANVAGQTLAISTDNFTNTGTAEATNGGILTLAPNTTTTSTGLLAANSGGILNISGVLNSDTGNSINGVGGTVNIAGASLLGTINGASGTSLIFNGDGRNNFNNTTVNANLDLATNANAYVQLFNTDTLNKTTTLGTTSNGLALYDNATNLVNAGTLQGFGAVFQQNGGATFTNSGTVNANLAGNTLAISTDNFTNTGTVEVQNGATLATAGNTTTTDSGNILVKQGGTATFGNPLTQTAGLTQVDGTLNSPLTLTGGTLAGTGTVNGNVVNSGGTVSAGNSASPFGTLAVSGTFSQTSGALDAAFSSTKNNLLAVSGAVTTGGVLSVNYLGTGPYTGAGPFTFLDYGSLATEPTNPTGLDQYFSNETVLTNTTGLITGSNGFLYELINNTGADDFQLQVVTNGAPTPAVPEASTTVSFGLLLLLGGGGLVIAKRRRTAAAS